MQTGPSSFEALLDYLRRARGFDFTGYKRPTLHRRIRKRMQTVGIEDEGEYLDYLEVHPLEFTELFNTILINVTSFFRDPETWDYLGADIVPRIIETTVDRPIRVWSAGCASGEEAFSLAILFAEALGAAAAQDRVKIYATDVDEDALTQGRAARFTAQAMRSVPEPLQEKYFIPTQEGHQFNGDLRRLVIFGRHDLVQDAPISRVDLLLCRNTLMYFNADTQASTLAKFHFALNREGFMALGKSEMLLTRSNLFVPVDLRRRVFMPVGKHIRDDTLLTRLVAERESIVADGLVKDAAFEHGPIPALVIDVNRTLVAANRAVRSLLGIAHKDIGSPFQDLEVSYRPAELRSLIDAALAGGEQLRLDRVEWDRGGQPRYLDIDVTPAPAGDGDAVGVVITFRDITDAQRLRQELEAINSQLETAYEELQSTVEELETTNEELQSTNEELETTNEELQSTNEELETMNEELQTTNEELEAANDELRLRTSDLNRARTYLASILENHPASVVLLDPVQRVQLWNGRARNMWGLHIDDVRDEHFLNLDIGLDLGALHEPIRSALHGDQPPTVTLEAVNRLGSTFSCRVTVVPVGPDKLDGAVVFMEDVGSAEASSDGG